MLEYPDGSVTMTVHQGPNLILYEHLWNIVEINGELPANYDGHLLFNRDWGLVVSHPSASIEGRQTSVEVVGSNS